MGFLGQALCMLKFYTSADTELSFSCFSFSFSSFSSISAVSKAIEQHSGKLLSQKKKLTTKSPKYQTEEEQIAGTPQLLSAKTKQRSSLDPFESMSVYINLDQDSIRLAWLNRRDGQGTWIFI